MRNAQVVGLIRDIVTELQPFTSSRRLGDSIWDGKAYTKHVGAEFHLDPHALMWWSTLSSVAEMVERQQSPLTKEQLEYLKRMDPNSIGPEATAVNTRLEKIKSKLFEILEA